MRLMYAAIVLAVVLFAGCSGGSSNAATPTPTTQRPSASGSAPEVATCAPGAVSGVSDAPVGATAMMSLVLWFGQAGTDAPGYLSTVTVRVGAGRHAYIQKVLLTVPLRGPTSKVQPRFRRLQAP